MQFLNIADTTKLVNSIGKRGTALQRDIHKAACSTLKHIVDHGDTTLAVRLMNVLPNGQRVKGLALWYKHFSGGKFHVRKDKKAGGWVGVLEKDRTPESFDLQGAVEVNYADFSEEKEPTQMTPEALLKYLEKVATNENTLPNGEPKVSPQAAELARRMLVAVAEAA